MEGEYMTTLGQFCMQESNNYAVCTQNVIDTYVVKTIEHNYWSLNSYQGAGQIGFGFYNPSIQATLSYPYQGYTLQMTAFNNASFA